ncbi:hypothetical protein [Longimicrobium terrae]|uniref:Uncharacterized protein n=1 Tax=Longimicrobium terrae TaxID=1639882 RepID=A0A841GQY3_9BACT|nr:hypothetical protein [Longimicrobium terrae]MBB4635568.1 hypothetical protein [Longimicrobium terrae]MBB6069962.1 hypothetical protein [Longimicrobium terrae]NNC32873.1 hypothetical protein [Longimicrobium terrae]
MTTAELLDRSAVTPAFRDAMLQFLRDGRSSERIRFGYGCPAVKVERTLHKALVEYPQVPVESIEVAAASGCEYFRGQMTVRTASDETHVAFHWDCKWRAEQEGWRDWFGFPDQARAAREFGWDCFRVWDEEPRGALVMQASRKATPISIDASFA